jgi:hypothetical protein
MSISLPWLWIVGHLAAMLGALLLVLHALMPARIPAIAGAVGGVVGIGVLGWILLAIDQSFFGVYRWLAWVVAFLAGYAAAALAAHLALLVRRLAVQGSSKRPG